jgi:hypothetical protein
MSYDEEERGSGFDEEMDGAEPTHDEDMPLDGGDMDFGLDEEDPDKDS